MDNWQLHVQDHVARLTLNRPDNLNNLSADTLLELREVARDISSRKEIRAVIVSGAGKHFCSGVDVELIGNMVGRASDEFGRNLKELQECIDAFEALNKPTIAEIRGFCVGGGMILAACCDFRVASSKAVFSLPEVKRGIGVIMGTRRITRLVGVAAAKEWILLGERFGAKQALARGFLNRLAEPADLEGETARLAAKLIALPPRAVTVCKRIIDEGELMDHRAGQDLEIEAQAELLNSADFKEAMDAYFEGRKPVYTGE